MWSLGPGHLTSMSGDPVRGKPACVRIDSGSA